MGSIDLKYDIENGNIRVEYNGLAQFREGLNIGNRTIYLRPTYIDMDTNPLKKVGTITFGSLEDTNLYRLEADVLKTDDNFDTGALRVSGTEVITSGRILQNIIEVSIKKTLAIAGEILAKFSDAQVTNGYLQIEEGTSYPSAFIPIIKGRSVGISGVGTGIIGLIPDTNDITTSNLAAVFIDGRKDSGALANAYLFMVRNYGTDKFHIEADGDTWFSGILKIGADVNLYRSAANQLKTDDSFIAIGDVGIGRAPGTIGYKKLEIYGTDSSGAGPHIQAVTSLDNYPVFQILNWSHDNVSINFDIYYEGSWKASYAGPFYQLYKAGNYLKLISGEGTAGGASVTKYTTWRWYPYGRVDKWTYDSNWGFVNYWKPTRVKYSGGLYYGGSYYNLVYYGFYLNLGLNNINYVKFYDGATYTDRSEYMRIWKGTSYSFLPTTSDIIYVGDSSTFTELYLEFEILGAGYTLIWEYWNGTTWTSLTVTDETSNATANGWVYWTAPGDWAQTTVDGVSQYWVRVRTTTGPTTTAKIRFCARGTCYGYPLRIRNSEYDFFYVRYDGKVWSRGPMDMQYLLIDGVTIINESKELKGLDSVQQDLTLGDAYKILWSDVNLYRFGANNLATDDDLRVGGGLRTFEAIVIGNTYFNIILRHTEPSIEFGDRSTTWDVNLYRYGADELGTDDRLVLNRSLDEHLLLTNSSVPRIRIVPSDLLNPDVAVFVVTDPTNTYDWFRINKAGKLEWGSGSAVPDTTLYRSAASVLKTDGIFETMGIKIGTGTTDWRPYAIDSKANYLLLQRDGLCPIELWGTRVEIRTSLRMLTNRILWGTLGSEDVSLYRSAANVLQTDDRFQSVMAFSEPGQVGIEAAAPYFFVKETDETNYPRWRFGSYGGKFTAVYLDDVTAADIMLQVTKEGQLQLPKAGSSAGILLGGDTIIYRSAANVLKTDDNLDVLAMRISGTEVITSGRVLQNISRLDMQGSIICRSVPQPFGNLAFVEGFDRYTSASELDANWDYVKRTSTITFETGFGGLGQSIRSYDVTGSLGLEFYKDILSSKVVCVRFNYKDRSGGTNMYEGIPDFEGDGELRTYQEGGYLRYMDPTGVRTSICPIPLNEWCEILWFVDMNTDTFKVWVNGDYKGEFSITTSGTYINRIRFRSNYASATEDYELDNIQVWIPASVKHEFPSSLILRDGEKLQWSDVNLYRETANVLKTEDSFEIGDTIYNIKISHTTPKIFFGNRSTAWDVNLYRSAADILKTDDAFTATDHIRIEPLSGATTEGGELDLLGAGTYATWHLDNFLGRFRLQSGGLVYFEMDTDRLLLRGHLKPWSSDTFSLGSSGNQWSEIFAKRYKIVDGWSWWGLALEDDITALILTEKVANRDMLLFNFPYKYEYDDGAGWVTGTVDTSIKNLFIGKVFGFEIPNGRVGIRFTWNNIGYYWFTFYYIYFSTRGNYMDILLEASPDGTTWTTVFTESNVSGWPGQFLHKKHFSNANYYPYLRFTFTFTWQNTNSAHLYNIRLFCSYTPYGGAYDLNKIIDWNYNKVLYPRNSIIPIENNAYDFGSSTNQWRNVYLGNKLIIGGDVNLYRGGSDVLRTDDMFDSNRSSSTDYAFASRVAGAWPANFAIRADGRMEWGPGGTSRDVNLYRLGAHQLATDDQFRITYAGAWDQLVFDTTSGDTRIAKTKIAASHNWLWLDVYADPGYYATIGVFRGLVSGTPRFFILPGDGTATPAFNFLPKDNLIIIGGDVNLYRSAPDVLKTDDNFQIADGMRLRWSDVELYRDAANRLRLADYDDIYTVSSFLLRPHIFSYFAGEGFNLDWRFNDAFANLNLKPNVTITVSSAPDVGTVDDIWLYKVHAYPIWYEASLPVTITLDFSAIAPVHWWIGFAIGFSHNYYSTGIKIEYYHHTDLAWYTLREVTDNDKGYFLWSGWLDNVRMIRFTFSGTAPFGEIRVDKICGFRAQPADTTFDAYPGWAFIKNGEDKMMGHLRVLNDNIYDLGELTSQWRNLYIGNQLILSGDVNLYRSDVDELTIPDKLILDRDVDGLLTLKTVDPQTALRFQNEDTGDLFDIRWNWQGHPFFQIYDSSAGTWRYPLFFKADTGDVYLGSGRKLIFDWANPDVNLYRSDANILKTDDYLDVADIRIAGPASPPYIHFRAATGETPYIVAYRSGGYISGIRFRESDRSLRIITETDVANQWAERLRIFGGAATGVAGIYTPETIDMKSVKIGGIEVITSGRVLQNITMDGAQIIDATITTAKVADLAITEPKIGAGAVTTPKIADLAVDTPKIVDLAITTPKIADFAITTPKITDQNVTLPKIDPDIGMRTGATLYTWYKAYSTGEVSTSERWGREVYRRIEFGDPNVRYHLRRIFLELKSDLGAGAYSRYNVFCDVYVLWGTETISYKDILQGVDNAALWWTGIENLGSGTCLFEIIKYTVYSIRYNDLGSPGNPAAVDYDPGTYSRWKIYKNFGTAQDWSAYKAIGLETFVHPKTAVTSISFRVRICSDADYSETNYYEWTFSTEKIEYEPDGHTKRFDQMTVVGSPSLSSVYRISIEVTNDLNENLVAIGHLVLSGTEFYILNAYDQDTYKELNEFMDTLGPKNTDVTLVHYLGVTGTSLSPNIGWVRYPSSDLRVKSYLEEIV